MAIESNGRRGLRLPAYFEFLRRHPILARLWWGALVSTVGDMLSWTTLTWVVVERTGSGSAVAILLLAHAVPSALTGPLIGRWLDKGGVRGIVIVDNVLRAVLVAAIPVVDHFGQLSLPFLWGVTALLGALSPATRVGMGVAIPRMTQPRERVTANTAFASAEPIASVAGPALAGILLARFGLAAAMWIDALTFVAMALAAYGLPSRLTGNVETDGEPEHGAPVQSPARWLVQPLPLAATLLSGLFFFSYGPTEAALPLLIRKELDAGAGVFGGAWSMVGIGTVIGGLFTPTLDRLRRTGLLLGGIMACWGGVTLGMARAASPWELLVLFFVGGIFWGPYLPLKTTLMQRCIPGNQLGAVLGLQSSFLAPTMPLGAALGGWMLTRWEPRTIISSVGWACLGGAALAILVPALRKRDPEPVDRETSG